MKNTDIYLLAHPRINYFHENLRADPVAATFVAVAFKPRRKGAHDRQSKSPRRFDGGGFECDEGWLLLHQFYRCHAPESS
jgi:hypothetical protein